MSKSDVGLSTAEIAERVRELDRRYLVWDAARRRFEQTQELSDWTDALKAMREYQWLVRNTGAVGWTH